MHRSNWEVPGLDPRWYFSIWNDHNPSHQPMGCSGCEFRSSHHAPVSSKGTAGTSNLGYIELMHAYTCTSLQEPTAHAVVCVERAINSQCKSSEKAHVKLVRAPRLEVISDSPLVLHFLLLLFLLLPTACTVNCSGPAGVLWGLSVTNTVIVSAT